MRTPTSAACVMGLVLSALAGSTLHAADRQWQVGTWTKVDVARQIVDFGPSSSGFGPATSSPAMKAMADVHTYVIEAGDLVIELKDVVPVGRRSLDAVVGEKVTFAVDKGSAYVRDSSGGEHKLRLIKKTSKTIG
jgi:hypothetical protein